MARSKNYHYVLVFTESGPVFVTSVDNRAQIAHWEKEEEPKALPKYYAEDMVLGLELNGHNAVLVTSKHKQYQPYNYQNYVCDFKEKYPDEC